MLTFLVGGLLRRVCSLARSVIVFTEWRKHSVGGRDLLLVRQVLHAIKPRVLGSSSILLRRVESQP